MALIFVLTVLAATLLAGVEKATSADEVLTAFDSFEEYEQIFSSSNVASVVATVPPSNSKWPQYVPPGPFFFDTECFGRFENFCPRASKFCRWYTQSDPTCYDQRFVSVTIPPVQVESQKSIPLHVKFFQFNYGVHLVEGTFFKRFYSVNVDECAALCLKSAAGTLGQRRDKLRCMSFDFYPFEVWQAQAPYNEAQNKGICVLNNETKDTARLRNEDQGLTDAELFYKSHCSRRPFSAADGYYEVRDPRGTLTPLLEYAGPTSLGLEAPWGGSRWGMFHPNLPGYVPSPLVPTLNCNISNAEDPDPPSFRGGFTPVGDDQHCPGLMTKSEAKTMCARVGGELCANQTDLNNISGRKLGCSFDQSGNGLIWHDGIVDRGQRMYPRCCATYFLPLSNIESGRGACAPYDDANTRFCSNFKSVTECEYTKNPYNPESKYRQSWLEGFGEGLDKIRQECQNRSNAIPGFNCSGMSLGPWETKTNCIWCPQAGLYPIGGNGQCRPGGSYGICPSASNQQRTIFGLRVRSACSEFTNCALIENYPDLRPFMGNYTFEDVMVGEIPKVTAFPTLASPTSKPTTRSPTQRPTPPTKAPTTAFPTAARFAIRTSAPVKFQGPDFGNEE